MKIVMKIYNENLRQKFAKKIYFETYLGNLF